MNTNNSDESISLFDDDIAAFKAKRARERLAKEQLAQEQLAKERIEQEKLAKEQAQIEQARKQEQERLEQLKQAELEKARLERLAQDKQEQEKQEQEKQAQEKARLEQARLEKEKLDRQKQELEQEKLEQEPAEQVKAETESTEKGWFSRMKTGLTKSRKNLAEGMMNILVGGKEIDDELLEEVEDQLLVADIGVEATQRIIDNLTEQTERGDLIYSNALYKALQKELVQILSPSVEELIIDTSKQPYVILVVGVNGVGKTTTIGKLAKRLQNEGKSVMLAAGDTFRAAATEQLQIWGERNNIPVVAQGDGSDSASVIFDAMSSAKAKGIDVLIADTAGRLHNKDNLMEELKKVVRVIKKSDPSAPHESMIVVDAGTGQNAINQVNVFNQAVQLTGITVTKLDGTAKGGVLFNVASKTDVPIRYIGVGEKIDDLQAFDPKEFVEALFDTD